MFKRDIQELELRGLGISGFGKRIRVRVKNWFLIWEHGYIMIPP